MVYDRCKLISLSFEATGCFTVSGQSETPFFLDICRLILLFFKPLIKHSVGFDFLKKNEIFQYVDAQAQV